MSRLIVACVLLACVLASGAATESDDPSSVFVTEPHDAWVRPGGTVQLDCELTASSEQDICAWRLAGTHLGVDHFYNVAPPDRVRPLFPEHERICSLLIEDTDWRHDGFWTCWPLAVTSHVSSRDARITVTDKTTPVPPSSARTTTETTWRPSAETTQWPSTETTEWPSTETTEWPSTETTEWPSTETTRWPSTETTWRPSAETTQWPSTETTEWPSTETTWWRSTETSSPGTTDTFTTTSASATTDRPWPSTETATSTSAAPPTAETTSTDMSPTSGAPPATTTTTAPSTTTEQPITTVSPSPSPEFVCPQPNGPFADPADTRYFYYCEDDVAVHMQCESPKQWNDTRKTCL